MKTFLFVLTLLPLLVHSQLSIHTGLNVGDICGSYTAPYSNPNEDIINFPFAFPGGEIGYQFSNRFEVRAFIYWGEIDKGAFWQYSANSSIFKLGIRPQYHLWRFGNEAWSISAGLPLAHLKESVDWRVTQDDWNLFGGTSSDSAAGKDNVSIYSIGVAPTITWELPKVPLSIEFSLQFCLQRLNSFDRQVHYDTIEETPYRESKPGIWNSVTEARLSLGYRFEQ